MVVGWLLWVVNDQHGGGSMVGYGVSACVCVSLGENIRLANILYAAFIYFFISRMTLRITRVRNTI